MHIKFISGKYIVIDFFQLNVFKLEILKRKNIGWNKQKINLNRLCALESNTVAYRKVKVNVEEETRNKMKKIKKKIGIKGGSQPVPQRHQKTMSYTSD